MRIPSLFLRYILIIFLFPACLNAQVTKLGHAVDSLSRFIASDYFKGLKANTNDLALTDTLYNRALQFWDNDIQDALLSLTFATVPYKYIPMVLPLIKLRINVPIFSANDSVFALKNKHLPKELFYNSPQDQFGDQDKLAHFFGSAYLGYISRIFDFTKIIGIFVEDFEKAFYVQSAVDPRDLAADELGEFFGKALRKNKNLSPSGTLVTYPLIFFRNTL
ncbi:MAG: hypothetical protein ACM3S2_16885 [Ignavibacteriales bacterium]